MSGKITEEDILNYLESVIAKARIDYDNGEFDDRQLAHELLRGIYRYSGWLNRVVQNHIRGNFKESGVPDFGSKK